MKLDYLGRINTDGDNVVRLYEFDKAQAEMFRDIVQQVIVTNQTDLELSSIEFIEARNCTLTLRIADEDLGITTLDNHNFTCELTIEGYIKMVALLAPFCRKETRGYQYLYDIDNPTDFLFTPSATWE